MPCYPEYETAAERVYEPEREEQNELNQLRDAAFSRLEAELQAGLARIETNPLTGSVIIAGISAGARPEGMSDLCILAGLQERNSLAWQTASAAAGVKDKRFVAAHAHAHAHGHKH